MAAFLMVGQEIDTQNGINNHSFTGLELRVCFAVCALSRNILNEIACSNLNCSTPPPLTVEPRSSFKLFTSDMVPC